MEMAKTSAHTGDGVDKAFARLATTIESLDMEKPRTRSDDILMEICHVDTPSEASHESQSWC
jgi:hypothetical protein